MLCTLREFPVQTSSSSIMVSMQASLPALPAPLPSTNPPCSEAAPPGTARTAPQAPTNPPAPKLPQQPMTTPIPARSYSLSPSVEAIEDLEYEWVYMALRNSQQIRQKLCALKKIPTSVISSFEKCIDWPIKVNGVNIHPMHRTQYSHVIVWTWLPTIAVAKPQFRIRKLCKSMEPASLVATTYNATNYTKIGMATTVG